MDDAISGAARVGQSLWLDYLHRKAIDNGELAAQIGEGGITGLTSNPAIFEKAIGGDALYAERLGRLLEKGDVGAAQLYEAVATDDIRAACDLLRPVYDRTGGADGYASLEVSPDVASDTAATLSEARRLWAAVGRPNVMIKVPGTDAGIRAVEQLIGDGVNVNVTLLFGLDAYRQVAEAYQRGLERRAADGSELGGVASVASFFVSRVDAKVDALLKGAAAEGALRGKTAIANAKCAYELYLRLVAAPRWLALAARGARPQRLLWASTSVKDPAYPELMYVEELMGPQTVDTMPPATYDAFRRHGHAESRLGRGLDQANATLAALAEAGVDFGRVEAELLDEGVTLFKAAFAKLLGAVDKRRGEASQRLDAVVRRGRSAGGPDVVL